MNMTTPILRGLDEMTADELLAEVALCGEAADDAAQRLFLAQQALIARMEQNGASELVTEAHTATLSTKYTYDPHRLHPLLEIDGVTQHELEAAGAYVPEHDETVPARWNATKVKVFRKRSSEIARVVDDARIEGRTTVRVVAK